MERGFLHLILIDKTMSARGTVSLISLSYFFLLKQKFPKHAHEFIVYNPYQAQLTLPSDISFFIVTSISSLLKEIIVRFSKIIVLNGRYPINLVLSFLFRRSIVIQHNSSYPTWKFAFFKKIFLFFFYRNANILLAQTPSEIQNICRIFPQSGKISLFPFPIKPCFYNVYPIFWEEDFCFVSIGNIVPVKNHLYSIMAFHIFTQKFPNLKTRFSIIGAFLDSHYLKELKWYIAQYWLQKHVILTGWISQEDIWSIIEKSHMGIINSLSEGQCMAAYEMGVSLPLLLSWLETFSHFWQFVLFSDPSDVNWLAKNMEEGYLRRKEFQWKLSTQRQYLSDFLSQWSACEVLEKFVSE